MNEDSFIFPLTDKKLLFSAYEDPYFVLDTNLRITALWRDYTPCGILAVFSGRRQRGCTAGEALEALNLRREANRRAEAKALALAVATRSNKLKRRQQPRGSLRFVNKPKRTTRRVIGKAKTTSRPTREKNLRFLMNDCLLSQGFAGEALKPSTSRSSRSETRGELGNRSYRRTSFRKINVTYKRPLPPFPVCTFEDKNVKIVISDIYDRYEISKSELKRGTSHHRYEYLDEEDSRGKLYVLVDLQ